MTLRTVSINSLQSAVDFSFRIFPQDIPDHYLLREVKIISHRGEHNNREVIENTMHAFNRAYRSHVWGIELDIRWTADLHPVVIHDAATTRLFHKDIKVANVTLDFLKERIPQIPTLEEVIKQYGHKMHLMIEIKNEHYPDPVQQNKILSRIISPLIPVKDYHFLALDPKIFENITFVPLTAFLTVSEMNTKKLSRIALQKRFGGIAGHYLLVTNNLISDHQKVNQQVGTGFISSRNALFREINRGVDWIFSNRAGALQKIVDDCLRYGIK